MAIFVGNRQIQNVLKGNKLLLKANKGRKVIFSPGGNVLNGSSPALAAPSAIYLRDVAGITSNGNYWLDGGSGAYLAYVKMDQGGGWINVNLNNSIYANLLTSGWGTGGSNMIANGGTGTALLNASNSTHAQANSYGCSSAPYRSYVDLDSTFASDFGITEVRVKILYISDNGNVVCGPYWTNTTSSRTIVQGTSTEVNGACNNTPNRYSDVVGTNFTVEFYGPLNTVTRLIESWTACGGSFTMQLQELYVR